MSTNHFDPKFDVRTLEQALRKGTIDRKELSDYLKSLPDESKKAEEISFAEEKTSASAGLTFAPAGNS